MLTIYEVVCLVLVLALSWWKTFPDSRLVLDVAIKALLTVAEGDWLKGHSVAEASLSHEGL